MLAHIIKSKYYNNEAPRDYQGSHSCPDLPSENWDRVHSQTFTHTHTRLFCVCQRYYTHNNAFHSQNETKQKSCKGVTILPLSIKKMAKQFAQASQIGSSRIRIWIWEFLSQKPKFCNLRNVTLSSYVYFFHFVGTSIGYHLGSEFWEGL